MTPKKELVATNTATPTASEGIDDHTKQHISLRIKK